MGFKIKYVLKKSKLVFIVAIALWLIFSIFLVAPITNSLVESRINDKVDINQFNQNMGTNLSNVFGTFKKAFQEEYRQQYLKGEGYLTLVIFFLMLIGFIKMVPKHEYQDIEHGSSDWSEHGEQYKILNSKKGILLAEKNYLPVDKRGNTNVLVVGRFWFW